MVTRFSNGHPAANVRKIAPFVADDGNFSFGVTLNMSSGPLSTLQVA
jgi:hypothetical protein